MNLDDSKLLKVEPFYKPEAEKEDHIQSVCEQLEDLSNELRGIQMTEEQWQTVRTTWIEFAKTFEPCRPQQKTKEWSKEDAYDDAMKDLK